MRRLPFIQSTLVIVLGLVLFGGQFALADLPITATDRQINNATYRWVNMNEIIASFPQNIGTGNQVKFKNPYGIDNYWDSITGNGGPYFIYGVNSGTCQTNGSKVTADPAHPSKADKIFINYAALQPGATGTPCTNATVRNNVTISDTNNADIMYMLSNDNNHIVRVDGDTGYSFTRANINGVNNVYTKDNSNNGCADTIVITNPADVPGNAKLYQLSTGSGAAIPASVHASSGCHINGDTSDVTQQGQGPNTTSPFTIHVGGFNINATGGGSSTGLPSGSTTPATSSSSSAGNGCGDTGGLAWVVCPAVSYLNDMVVKIYTNLIVPMLQVPNLNDPSFDILKAVWGSFQGIADVSFVIIFLVIIFSTASSTGVDSYTIKKALPKLFIAAILVQFSYVLCGLAVDVGNVLGLGIIDLVQNAIAGIPNQTPSDAGQNTASFLVAGAVGVGAVVAIASTALAPVVLMALLGFFIAIVVFVATLEVRMILIYVLVATAPIAMMLWVLPNTEKLFRKWLDYFLKAIFMFPIISLLFAAGILVSKIGSTTGGELAAIVSLLGPIIAFCLMPASFKWAGAGMAITSGAAKKLGGKTVDKAGNSKAMGRLQASSNKRTLQAATGTGFRAKRAQVAGGFGLGMTSASRAMRDTELNTQRRALETKARDASIRALESESSDAILAKAKGGSSADKAAAVSILSQRGNMSKLGDLNKSMGEKAYGEAVAKSGAQQQILKSAPHLAGLSKEDTDAHYNKLGAKDISELSAEGIKHMAASGNADGKQKLLDQIRQTPTLNNNMSGDKRSAFEGAYNTYSSDPTKPLVTDGKMGSEDFWTPAYSSSAAAAAESGSAVPSATDPGSVSVPLTSSDTHDADMASRMGGGGPAGLSAHDADMASRMGGGGPAGL